MCMKILEVQNNIFVFHLIDPEIPIWFMQAIVKEWFGTVWKLWYQLALEKQDQKEIKHLLKWFYKNSTLSLLDDHVRKVNNRFKQQCKDKTSNPEDFHYHFEVNGMWNIQK